jgi:hypothetical protein
MTYSLRGSYIHEEHSTGRHLRCQPRQLSWVRMIGPRSCMPKMRSRENPLVVLGLIKGGTAAALFDSPCAEELASTVGQ